MSRKILYVSDLDGTLLDRNAALSEYTKTALNRLISRGINFTVATGRTTDAAMNIMDDIGLNLPLISFNGVVVYDTAKKRCIRVALLDVRAVKNIIAVLKSYNVPALMYQFTDNSPTAYFESLKQRHIYSFVEDRRKRFNTVFHETDDLNDITPEHIIYFTIIDTHERVGPVYSALKKIPDINVSLINSTYSDEYWILEIFSEGASKQHAVAFLRETYGYKNIIGFGDNHNDLPMFEACDIRVAVNNAQEEVITAADCVCESHDRDGVVKWIENHVLSPGNI
jgi:Cof subfamily protein (haloacid dehalogenase superfamily)